MDNEIVKVCVRIPRTRKSELLKLADSWRSEDQIANTRAPGWDARAIHKIAKDNYGGLLGMFERHSWTERGSDMMRHVQRQVRESYGSVENFVAKHS